jgi:hypothetical protein
MPDLHAHPPRPAIGYVGNVTVDELPDGIWELRNALLDDLHYSVS